MGDGLCGGGTAGGGTLERLGLVFDEVAALVAYKAVGFVEEMDYEEDYLVDGEGEEYPAPPG